MSTFENLEKWLVDNDKTKLNEWRSHMVKEAFIGGWQAATAESDKHIAELKNTIEINHAFMRANDEEVIALQSGIYKLHSYINVLREALESSHKELLSVIDSINQDKVHHDGDDFHETLHKNEKAIASTPAQSLQAHNDEMIERVITLLKDSAWDDGTIDMRIDDLIEDVRALKGK